MALVALDTVWLRVSDETGKRLFEKEMAAGERYDVPVEVAHPIARTGRPDKLQVTINGSDVPPLGTGAQAVSIDVSAAALRARATPAATPSPTPGAAAPSARRLGPRAPDSIDYSAPAPPANASAAP